MRCRECESLLWSYIDDELPESQRQALASHLAECPFCGAAHDELRAFPLQVGNLRAVPPPPDFTARLMQRIAPLPTPQELSLQGQRPRLDGWNRPLGALMAFSAAAAAIFLGLISTAMLALANGQPLPRIETGNSASGIANAIGVGVVVAFWQHLSWPIVAALAGMLAVLVFLWLRVVTPQGWADQRQGLRPLPRRRR